MPTSSSSSQPDCVLLNVHAYLGQSRNGTTASATTRNHEKIEVSLCPAPPPLPSNLFVHCPELRLTAVPRVIRAVEDVFLLRVAVGCQPDYTSPDDSDYFVYRAAGTKGREPSLMRLSRPHPCFHDADVGLLSRGGNYTIAALIAIGAPVDVYDLHIFHSENPSGWIYRNVSVTEPQRRLPLVIPERCGRLLYHDMSTVISIGGEAGTMGWVDLWRGILLCDLLRDEPTLRGVPLPVPLDLVSCDNGLGTELGCPIPFRAIAFANGCLKLVHLEAKATLVADDKDDEETESPSFRMRDWTIVTYTNTAMTSSWKDWHRDCWLEASGITIDTHIKAELTRSGLLSDQLALHNLLVSHPAPASSAAREGVVYLMARKKYQHHEAWILALDTRNKTLLGAAEFEVERQPFPPAMYYWPSGIAK
ncbi:hypothetical protein ACQ4PT_016415 [Festuca glaucescens]